MDGLDAFTRKAFEMVTSPAAQQAFAIGQEDDRTRDLYGRTKLGQSLLLARRLVEAGVTFVTVDAGGWDTHANNFEALKTKKLPEFDRAWAGLMQDMHAPRPDEEHAGAGLGRVRPDAADQQGRRPRPLARARCRSSWPAAA